MVFHSSIVILIGSFAGFAWLIALAGYLQLWPLPPMEIPVPEPKRTLAKRPRWAHCSWNASGIGCLPRFSFEIN